MFKFRNKKSFRKVKRKKCFLSGKYKSNTEIGTPSKKYFNDEVKKYAYMWREGGQFSTEKYLNK